MKRSRTNRWCKRTVGISKPHIYYWEGYWRVLYLAPPDNNKLDPRSIHNYLANKFVSYLNKEDLSYVS